MNILSIKNKGFVTTIIVVILAMLVVVGLFFLKPNSKAPSSEEIQPMLETFILKSKCSGSSQILQLTDITVGDYNNQFKAWPIYAAYKTSCETINSSGRRTTNTYSNTNSSYSDTAIAFARKSGSEYEVFMPGVVTDMMDDLNNKLQNASDKGLEEFKANLKTQ